MRKKHRIIQKVSIIAAVIGLMLTGCVPETEPPPDTFETQEDFLAYVRESKDESLSKVAEYYIPENVPEGMEFNRIEVLPERHLITFYYSLGRYEPTLEEIAAEATKDIDLSGFSMFGTFPTIGSQDNSYSPDKAERAVLKESDEYQFRWNYDGDGEELLRKGLEYYGDETSLGDLTGYVTPVTARMLVTNTPEGVGLETVFYQVVWVDDGRLFFAKVPVEFAETPQDLLPFMQIEKMELER